MAYQKSLAYILHLRVLDFLVLIFIGTLSLFNIPDQALPSEIWQGLSIAGILIFIFGFGIFISNKTKFLNILADILPQKLNIIPLFKQLAQFHNFSGIYFATLLWTFAIWGLEVLTCYLLAWSLLPNISFMAILSAIAVGNIMKALPLFPGGLGTYEAGFILLLSLYGIPYEITISLSIIDHLIKKAVNLIFGFPIYLHLQKENELLGKKLTLMPNK